MCICICFFVPNSIAALKFGYKSIHFIILKFKYFVVPNILAWIVRISGIKFWYPNQSHVCPSLRRLYNCLVEVHLVAYLSWVKGQTTQSTIHWWEVLFHWSSGHNTLQEMRHYTETCCWWLILLFEPIDGRVKVSSQQYIINVFHFLFNKINKTDDNDMTAAKDQIAGIVLVWQRRFVYTLISSIRRPSVNQELHWNESSMSSRFLFVGLPHVVYLLLNIIFDKFHVIFQIFKISKLYINFGPFRPCVLKQLIPKLSYVNCRCYRLWLVWLIQVVLQVKHFWELSYSLQWWPSGKTLDCRSRICGFKSHSWQKFISVMQTLSGFTQPIQ